MADADLSPAPRGLASRALRSGAVLLAGLALGAALGSGAGNSRLGGLPVPGIATLLLALSGIVAGGLALRSRLALRLFPALTLYAVAGLALTRFGAGLGVIFALVPTALWAARLGRESRPGGAILLLIGGLLGVGIASPGLIFAQARWTLPPLPIVIGLALAGAAVALTDPGARTPSPARFDLRAALALAGLVVVGFVVAFLGSVGMTYLTSSRESGGLGRAFPSSLPILLLAAFALLTVGFRRGDGRRAVFGLLGTSVAFLLAGVGSLTTLAIIALPIGLALLVEPSLRRAERAHEALGIGTVLLATLLGMPLAAGVVAGFTRPLLGAVTGIGTPMGTNWTPILLFYFLLALVVLLAHLAHAYEFGFAALEPTDDRDPLPILRKGLPKLRRKS